MAVQTKEVLKSYFETGDKPTQEEFADLIDTLVTEPDLEDKLKDISDKLKDISSFESVTYQSLLNLKEEKKLKPGQFYRITDYITTTSQENTKSAGHQFDVIVLALTNNTLAERAWACHHEGDTYFQNSNLEAWQIWYSLENNATRFAWANTKVDYTIHVPVSERMREYLLTVVRSNSSIPDTLICKWWDNPRNGPDGYGLDYYKATNIQMRADDELLVAFTCGTIPPSGVEFNETILGPDGSELPGNVFYLNAAPTKGIIDTIPTVINENIGKGVIYRMIDEWNNDCPYDFKNILFQRFAVTEYDKTPSLVVDNEENYYGYYYGTFDLLGDKVISRATYGGDSVWLYTFALKDLATGTWYDYTMLNHIGLKTDEGVIVTCNSNTLKEYRPEYLEGHEEKAAWLNNIVFYNCYTDISSPDYPDSYSRCYYNSFGNDCHSNTFGNGCNNNSFGNSCHSNTFGNGCNNNSFGNDCYSNTFGTEFISNKSGERCYYNTFGNYCTNNTFVAVVFNNKFGDDFRYNTLGNSCSFNTFGNTCDYNTLGNSCSSNTFGDSCSSNTFGNDCKSNTFGDSCKYNTFDKFCSNNTFENNCQYNTFGNGCGSNNFGERCQRNIFGDQCFANIFGINCHYNTFGKACIFITFGINCYNNTFGNTYETVTFGDECEGNTFGDGCSPLTFGDGCRGNTFGSSCVYNTFGNGCQSNILGNNCSGNIFGNFYRNNKLDEGVGVRLNNIQTASYNQQVQNYHITSGINGEIEVARNRDYETTVAKDSAGNVKQFCIADIIQ